MCVELQAIIGGFPVGPNVEPCVKREPDPSGEKPHRIF